ncbi:MULTISPECIES: hypothetical protein [unclassified Sporosarcina]|uniref:hypothetical protein n=1 Tax=unclassified Sporosarcina TaxID=2647733 RepID=UPI00130449D3|nr:MULTISPECIES: hypothetical protein [unclassified Sporosarcina]
MSLSCSLAVGGTLVTIGRVQIVYFVFNLMFFLQEGNTEFLIARGEEHASETLKWIE